MRRLVTLAYSSQSRREDCIGVDAHAQDVICNFSESKQHLKHHENQKKAWNSPDLLFDAITTSLIHIVVFFINNDLFLFQVNSRYLQKFLSFVKDILKCIIKGVEDEGKF